MAAMCLPFQKILVFFNRNFGLARGLLLDRELLNDSR
jgi:hypothetical protein